MACRAFIWAQMFTNVTKHYTPLCGHIKYFDQIKIEFLNKSAYPTAFAVLLYGTKELLLEVENTGKADFFHIFLELNALSMQDVLSAVICVLYVV